MATTAIVEQAAVSKVVEEAMESQDESVGRTDLEALPVLLGEAASGLSAANISRLLAVWETEYEAFRTRDLSELDYVYVWADGIHVNVRLGEQDRICLLVLLGVPVCRS